MKIVVKVGGSTSINEDGPDFSYFSKLVPVLNRIKKEHQLIVSIGGGGLTRSYHRSIEKFAMNSHEKEQIFIELIKSNVLTLAYLLKTKPIFSLDEVKRNTSGVIGGIKPGRSTDANAAIAAQKIQADVFVKLTDVNGIYSKDPNKFIGAKIISRMSFSDLQKYSTKGTPNNYGILDATAIKTLSKNKIITHIINGKNPDNILKVLKGASIGTTVS